MSQKGSHGVTRSVVSYAVYAQGAICFHWDPNPNLNPNHNHMTYDILDLVTYGDQREHYCDTENLLHKELSTVTYWDRVTKGMADNGLVTYQTLWHDMAHNRLVTYRTLWHIGYVTQRTGPQ